MAEVRKMINEIETILITEKDKKLAMEMLESASTVSVHDTMHDYKLSLDNYCVEFGVDNYFDLMKRADESEFSPSTCSDILDKFSFIERHQ